MRRSSAGQLMVAFAIVAVASGCGARAVNPVAAPVDPAAAPAARLPAQDISREHALEFAPVLAPAPSDISLRLAIDSTVAVAPSPSAQAEVGASAGSCPYALRDPRTGTGYMLAATRSVETRLDGPPSVVTVDAQANYLPSGDYRLPGDRYLRVECPSLRVLGLASEI